jgi:hypothetical protein
MNSFSLLTCFQPTHAPPTQIRHTPFESEPTSSTAIRFFCGNFGIILINSSWINIDGGKKALDILEKMVEVTMMRGKKYYP